MKITPLISFLTLTFLSLTSHVFSAVDLAGLIKDTQRITSDHKRITLVWWIPEQFWDESFRQQSGLTSQQKADFKKVMEPYAVFCVAVLDIGPMAGLSAKNKEFLLANTKLQIGKTVIPPLEAKDISADAANFYAMMKPVFSNMLGQMGQGMEFIIYRKDKFLEENLDPLKPGAFQYEASGETSHWRLPLGSLLPKKIDSSTKEEFPGDYNYNPFTGKKLKTKSQP